MALQLSQAVSDGIRRVLTRTGGILFVTLLAVQLFTQAAVNTAVLGSLPAEMAGQIGSAGLALPVSGRVGIVLSVVAVLATGLHLVVVSRALTRPARELSAFPSPLYARRIGRATFSTLLGGLIVVIAVTLGFAALILPGIFFSISFVFFAFAVGVEDAGVVGGLKRSWAMARGNRIKIGILVVLAGAFGGVLGVVGTVLDLIGLPLASEFAAAALNSVFFVLFYGVLASAYLQLSDGRPTGTGEPGSAGTAGGATPKL